MKQFLLISLIMLHTGVLFSQQGKNQQAKTPEQREARREKIESMKIAHIAQKLNLDPKTAEVFWPIYNQYEHEMRQLLQETRMRRNNNELSADDLLDNEQKALDIKKKYTAQFGKVLKPEQVSGLFQAEKEFRMMLMHKVREGQGQGKSRGAQQGPPMRR